MVRVSPESLRVAVLARSVYPLHRYGGLERHVFDLVRHLLDCGVRVTLIAPPAWRERPVDAGADKALANPRLTIMPISYRTFPFAGRRGTTIIDRSTAYPVFGWRAGRAATQLAHAGAVDIVHGLGASALGYTGRIPFVFNPQGLEEFGATNPARVPLKRLGYWPLRQAVRRCAQLADRVIATDRVLVETVVRHLRVPREVVRVVPNAIDPDQWDGPEAKVQASSLRRRFGLNPDDDLLLSVGRLEANKGFDVLVSALRSLSSDGVLSKRSWRWVLVGDGPMRQALTHAIQSSGLSANVVMCGRVSDAELHGWYEAATLFVHPTLYEGSSLVTLEAMAHRRAVVATRAGGLPDKVIPAVNGWLVEPGHHHALAASIKEALSDVGRLRRMGSESRAIVDREFSWVAVIRRLLDVYDELLQIPAVRYSHSP